MNIGLTGGISTGKSTVAALLAARGAHIIDADLIAREVVLPGSPVLREVAERFGNEILLPDGNLDRKKLGGIIFADALARKDLDGLLHPPIRALMRTRMAEQEAAEPTRLVVVDVPLLYESGLEYMFNEVMVVYVPEEIQLERLILRDKLSREQAGQRIASQMPIEDKKAKADIVIDNSESLQETEKQLEAFWQRKGLTL
ncbi:dephospho-CoA kinase [Paenibacillus swuensis]|uniref:Dephospho-CoA kinase n=1 Tax=Paenibacillus swuensis TaxID=1178515 RepID=A0A172TN10_9BACL|nr:dephospho-CoA kinase [Paenibacillus swuensis]ANE48362.1 dephospho-CoA kinase [Paenibacillus swuensis]